MEQVELLAPDGAERDYFGDSVSISGDYAIVGVPGDLNYYGKSHAYIFKKDGNEWTEQAKLFASDGNGNDGFGNSVSISGDYAIVGANRGGGVGSAYIFKLDGNSWIEQTKISPSDSAVGSSVSISGNYAIFGTLYDDNVDNLGAAYIYTLPAPILIPGDANSNGIVDLKDLQTCQQVLAGMAAEPFYLEAVDFNGNGRLDIGEQITVLRMISY
ncbi:MAG: hypothetical protein OMM_03912 [Candidatus Magnetoglobus multicellularis str. Araruama]|uniref:Dockerin domain-containing protein n=1 Tax=Candidatus Magnetoglobus multicellularis str. Araruama TaxID=890399 RepID=A0A1V1P3T3_9BACT|nr:MAG: hypothetical protein OMM_03912 [Candidatus Magnetoglobus multicellularis str. Araruama]